MSQITIALLLLNVLLLFAFLIKSKVLFFMSSGLRILFFMFFIISITSLLLPAPYQFLADQLLKQMGILSSIQSWDQNFFVTTLSDGAKDVVDGIKGLFGSGGSEEDLTLSQGFFEENFYPLFLNLVTMLLRIFSAVISLLGMGVTIYLSFATSAVYDNAVLKNRIENLEERIRFLEER